MENRSCPICTKQYPCRDLPLSDPAEIVGHNVQCTHCGLVYHNPVMSRQEMLSYYAHEFSEEYHESRAMQEELAESRVNFLKTFVDIKKISPAIEIGCAYGDFIAQLNSEGVDASGLEASEQLSQIAREDRKVDVVTAAFEEHDLAKNHYGAVAMFHVLEHFYDPIAVLKKVHSALQDDGYLYIEVPTVAESQLAQVFKVIHPTTFVSSTLNLMLERTGFSVCKIQAKGYNLVAIARKTKREGSYMDRPCPDEIYHDVEKYIEKRQSVLASIQVKMDGLLSKKKIAVYGAGHNTLDLDEVYPLSQLQFDSVYDADPVKQGKTLLGKTIRAPEALQDFQGDAVIISTYRYQEEVLENLAYLQDKGVELVTLYEK